MDGKASKKGKLSNIFEKESILPDKGGTQYIKKYLTKKARVTPPIGAEVKKYIKVRKKYYLQSVLGKEQKGAGLERAILMVL